MWNRSNGTAQEAFALRFIFTAPDHREVLAPFHLHTKQLCPLCLGVCQHTSALPVNLMESVRHKV